MIIGSQLGGVLVLERLPGSHGAFASEVLATQNSQSGGRCLVVCQAVLGAVRFGPQSDGHCTAHVAVGVLLSSTARCVLVCSRASGKMLLVEINLPAGIAQRWRVKGL